MGCSEVYDCADVNDIIQILNQAARFQAARSWVWKTRHGFLLRSRAAAACRREQSGLSRRNLQNAIVNFNLEYIQNKNKQKRLSIWFSRKVQITSKRQNLFSSLVCQNSQLSDMSSMTSLSEPVYKKRQKMTDWWVLCVAPTPSAIYAKSHVFIQVSGQSKFIIIGHFWEAGHLKADQSHEVCLLLYKKSLSIGPEHRDKY